jgi:hypothetical protein
MHYTIVSDLYDTYQVSDSKPPSWPCLRGSTLFSGEFEPAVLSLGYRGFRASFV